MLEDSNLPALIIVDIGAVDDEVHVMRSSRYTKKWSRDDVAMQIFKHRDNPRLVLVDPQSVVCERNECYLVRNGQANFRDTAHISNVNALQYRGLFDAAFKSALGKR
ncbi:hypothetical protein AC629_37370 [Bradyrhizobium sp. NAS80.1]|uniref:SGNH hydrolase domain-containing protein n=1 Tax=Bradyrhizobium sp. NAS80.1 TaxID=1680159 RepID=UPI0009659BF1|nr:SGNH hydrolase domain-containing protein [Bradyrhizobium sp. NAS80.1]OKO72826.1 hypothetical protein AC629_37370 [Bradyrhizobium sp. NAS80.1]